MSPGGGRDATEPAAPKDRMEGGLEDVGRAEIPRIPREFQCLERVVGLLSPPSGW